MFNVLVREMNISIPININVPFQGYVCVFMYVYINLFEFIPFCDS